MNNKRLSLPLMFVFLLLACPRRAQAQEQKKPAAGLASVRQYISAGWDNLTRSMTDCASVVDPKMKVNPVIYLPAGFAAPPAVENLHAACNVDIEHLPRPIHQLGEIDTNAIHPHGLLYLENKYVVPGGRFNEMYGWDSYFIILRSAARRPDRPRSWHGRKLFLRDRELRRFAEREPVLLSDPFPAALSEFDGAGRL